MKTKSFVKNHPKLIGVLKISLVFAMFWVVAWQRLDPDFGWHLQAGKYISNNGIPSHDIYSYTASNFKWIDHEWGYDVIIAFVHGLSHGWELLATLFACLWTAVIYISSKKRNLFLLVISTFAVLPYAGIRPTVFTLFFFALLLKIANNKSKRSLLTVPIIFMLWANLHGGLIIGLIMLGYFWFRDRDVCWLGILCLSIIATFINPYGPRLYDEIFRTILDSAVHNQITEWAIFTITFPSVLYILLWLFGYWLYEKDKLFNYVKAVAQRPLKNHKLDDQLLGPMMLIFAMSATRNIPIFVIATMSDLGDYLSDIKATLPKQLNRISYGILIVAGALTIYMGYISFRQSFASFSINRSVNYPSQAVDYLTQNKCSGNIFNSYIYGGYLIWKLPSQKVYIDGRMPVWPDGTGQRYMDDYFKISRDHDFQISQFKKYDIKCALVSQDTKRLINWLKNDHWVVKVNGNNALLLISP